LPQLTVAKLRAIRTDGKIRRYYDGRGLYIETSVAGGKYWRWRYTFGGKEKRLSLGAWPDVSLAEAREKCDDFRKLLRRGIDPGAQVDRRRGDNAITFRAVAAEFIANKRHVWSPNHATASENLLAHDVYPYIGSAPIKAIKPPDVLAVLRRIEERRAFTVASRVFGLCSMVFRYGVSTGAVDSDPCRDLRGALVHHARGQHAALTKPKDVGVLMRAIDDYKGSGIVRAALAFSAYTFCRPGEIRHAEWCEVDFDEMAWTVPAAKMKTRVEHYVPLSRQAAGVLLDIRPLTGGGRYVFPGPRGRKIPLSENAVNTALRSMGYTKEQMTAHGFRAMASTLLNELGYRLDVIESQLAHKGADKIRAVYNRAEYMAERRKLMQDWADYLDGLRG